MAIGKVYDSEETSRLSDFIDIKTSNLDAINNSSQAKDRKILNYSILMIGAIVVLLSLKLLIRKKK